MIDKRFPSADGALADVTEGATVLVSGFGTADIADQLIDALVARGPRELTLVCNNAGSGDTGLAASRGVQVNKVCAAVARELAGCVWSIAHQASRTQSH